MLERLDSIPWKKLKHAYGPASDVPALLRALATTPADMSDEESPLWQLFGNIWHQGTVYEATAHAVPFLLELAADKNTPDRVGILHLLSSIAQGSSYLEVHGNLLGERDFVQKKSQELRWKKDAHNAVAKGIDTLVAMTTESGDLSLAAAHVLANLHQHRDRASPILRKMLTAEKNPRRRMGLLLLLGQARDDSTEAVKLLLAALDSKDLGQRRAATYSLTQLGLKKLPVKARDAIADAITADDREDWCSGLPWDATAELDDETLEKSIDKRRASAIFDKLITAIEKGTAGHNTIVRLLDLVFEPYWRTKNKRVTVTIQKLTPTQRRAAQAIVTTYDRKKRMFLGAYEQWGLPSTRREMRNLAEGREPTPVDITLPLLAPASAPRKLVLPGTFKKGDRIIHRNYGLGTVKTVETKGRWTELTVDFDEETTMNLSVPSDGSPI